MQSNGSLFLGITLLGTACFSACKTPPPQTEGTEPKGPVSASRERYNREPGAHSGPELPLNGTFDEVQGGVRLVLSYDPDTHAFHGTLMNVIEMHLQDVQAEVHLSNGKQLGPTRATNLEPGERREFTFVPKTTDFDSWTPHLQVEHPEQGRSR